MDGNSPQKIAQPTRPAIRANMMRSLSSVHLPPPPLTSVPLNLAHRTNSTPVLSAISPVKKSSNTAVARHFFAAPNLADKENAAATELPPPHLMPGIYDDGEKPQYSYATLIGMAILRAPNRRLTLAQIYSWIMSTFKFYRTCDAGWQNSIRHNLSLNKAFSKQERPKDDPGKGNYWIVVPGNEYLFMKGRLRSKQDLYLKGRSRGKHDKLDASFPPDHQLDFSVESDRDLEPEGRQEQPRGVKRPAEEDEDEDEAGGRVEDRFVRERVEERVELMSSPELSMHAGGHADLTPRTAGLSAPGLMFSSSSPTSAPARSTVVATPATPATPAFLLPAFQADSARMLMLSSPVHESPRRVSPKRDFSPVQISSPFGSPIYLRQHQSPQRRLLAQVLQYSDPPMPSLLTDEDAAVSRACFGSPDKRARLDDFYNSSAIAYPHDDDELVYVSSASVEPRSRRVTVEDEIADVFGVDVCQVVKRAMNQWKA